MKHRTEFLESTIRRVILILSIFMCGIAVAACGPTTVHCVKTATGSGDYCYDSPGGGGVDLAPKRAGL